MPLTDGLIALSVRWMQPIQQHGRRLPSLISDFNRLRWFALVASCLTEIVQQIHSLRASGVRLFHLASNVASASKAALRSLGILWAVPVAIL